VNIPSELVTHVIYISMYHWTVDNSCIVETTPVGTVIRRFTTTDADLVDHNRIHRFTATTATLNPSGNVMCNSVISIYVGTYGCKITFNRLCKLKNWYDLQFI